MNSRTLLFALMVLGLVAVAYSSHPVLILIGLTAGGAFMLLHERRNRGGASHHALLVIGETLAILVVICCLMELGIGGTRAYFRYHHNLRIFELTGLVVASVAVLLTGRRDEETLHQNCRKISDVRFN